jgi:hypothetical protein
MPSCPARLHRRCARAAAAFHRVSYTFATASRCGTTAYSPPNLLRYRRDDRKDKKVGAVQKEKGGRGGAAVVTVSSPRSSHACGVRRAGDSPPATRRRFKNRPRPFLDVHEQRLIPSGLLWIL